MDDKRTRHLGGLSSPGSELCGGDGPLHVHTYIHIHNHTHTHANIQDQDQDQQQYQTPPEPAPTGGDGAAHWRPAAESRVFWERVRAYLFIPDGELARRGCPSSSSSSSCCCCCFSPRAAKARRHPASPSSAASTRSARSVQEKLSDLGAYLGTDDAAPGTEGGGG